MAVSIQTEPFDPGAETNAFLLANAGAGAAVTFTGLVRSQPEDPIGALILECYPELAINQVTAMIEQAVVRFGLIRAKVIHRYGTLRPGEPIVQVMALAPHREAAFQGAEFLMDYLKTDAPFWKQEETPDGTRWVDAKSQDDAAKARWE
ncbi:molybdenum cofactor biosynthesis protein MoaE [Youhaiella tibetensis]|uniref:Molybdopterin synthase catalytic subunit n=1 Tax=Paradevosia tibetensis TaxID=1447062 RepID=A0A5B9DQU4_9HYPH|nr:molybdenum cofactor biosynthesis protein MoaE [Youhaiella tibetensis]QEE21587.1 molybdenum cofactor biosynthesis protein MoaE [Youhaiella tibetensis]GGF13540.1 molybdenum cofactor biosynthesis protein MoaE [Youhaiella tibetensis]